MSVEVIKINGKEYVTLEQHKTEVTAAYAYIDEQLQEMGKFSCGCDPIHCSCDRDRETLGHAADMVSDLVGDLVEDGDKTALEVLLERAQEEGRAQGEQSFWSKIDAMEDIPV